MDQQRSDVPADEELLPIRMINEYVYCPRLFHLMHVEGRWEENAFTADGQRAHRRVDRLDHVLPGPAEAEPNTEDPEDGDPPPIVIRSVRLGSEALGIVSRLDLVATDGGQAVPVETKRGSPPDNPQRSWEPERVQLMAQGFLLREQGYDVTHGFIYYAGSRVRVEVPFDHDLEARTLRAIVEARVASKATLLPPPLQESPKCHGCSLNGICLPDETLALSDPERPPREVRRLYPARVNQVPLYVQEQGARVGKKDRMLVVRKGDDVLGDARIRDISQLVLCGNILVSQQATHALLEAEVPIVHLSSGHWFYGITQGFGLRNAYDRAAQFRIAGDAQRCLGLAKAFVLAKGTNQRALLRRNAEPRPGAALNAMQRTLADLHTATDLPALLGLEGLVARHYFGAFGSLLRPPQGELAFDFAGRNSRPPRDPVNALLSFGYALLAKECTVALASVGLDPHWGYYHQPRHGRPALALDLMEEFRPTIVDSAVVTAINTGAVTARNFTLSPRGCALGPEGRKAFIRTYEARLDHLATHPAFDYRCSYRQIIRLQAQLLARHLRGDVPAYVGITIR